MLSRGNSDAATRLRRAKSTSSVQSYRPATSDSSRVDPETAHQHAVVAASHAYEAAHGSPNKKPEGQRPTTAGEGAAERLERRQSVRFTGPTAVPIRQRSITRRQVPVSTTSRPKLQAAASFERHGPETLVQGSDGFVAVSNPNEYVERRVSSTPSSYKKIRKTKSMFNPSKAAPLSFMSGSSRSRGHRHSRSLTEDARPDIRRSLSYSQQHQASRDPGSGIVNQDAAVQLARDTYVRQLEQQRLKEKSSFMDFARPRKSAKAKAFRRTVRTSSTNSYGSAVGSQSQELPKSDGFGSRARSASTSFKDRLKRVFQKSADTKASLPKQQLEAGRPHFGDYMATSNGVQQRYDHHIPSPDNETLRRVDCRGPTSRDTSAFVSPSQPGSIRSVHSDTSSIEAPSRVSSWATSTIGSALTSSQARENKRLSIIHEHGGPYQPSSSMQSYNDLSRRYAAFNDPIRDFSTGSLFSKLKKEIEQNNRVAKLGKEIDQATSTKPSIADLTPRGSSYKARNLSTGTISEESLENSDPFTGAPKSKPVLFNPIAKSGDNWGEESRKGERNLSPSSEIPAPLEDGDLTPKGPLREIKSTFFPPSNRLERSSTSPYRRAMATSSEEQTVIRGSEIPGTSVATTTEDKRTGFLHVRSSSRSDSIYSRTTSGNTPAPSPSPPSLSGSKNGRGVGIAFVDSKPVRYEKPLSPTQQSRRSSAKSSGEWGRWLSHEVSQLERRTLSPSDGEVSPASTIGHKRERAQIDNDDVEIGKAETPKCASKQLFPVFGGDSVPKPVPKNQPIENPERAPLAEIGGSRLTLRREQLSSQSSQPAELRVRASHASLTNASSNLNLNKRYGMSLKPSQSRSTDTLRTTNSIGQLQTQVGESSGSHYSPEREARLRRMQSSNSVEQKRQQENKPFRNYAATPPLAGGYENARPSLVSPSSTDSHSPGSQLMIERFLSDRRRDMRISEESGADPAFL